MIYKYLLGLILFFNVINFSYAQSDSTLVAGRDRIVAIVNHEVITQSEVKEVFAVFYEQMSSRDSDKRIEAEFENMQEVALNRLIEDKLILEEARAQEIQIQQEAIDERLDQMKETFDTESEFQQALNTQDITIADLRRKIEEQLMMSIAVELNVKRGVSVSPVEITAYYQAHLDEFKAPESAEVDSIFCESLPQAKEALSLLRQGEDFNRIVEEKSSSSSLGIVKKGEFRKDIEDAIFTLEEGKTSGIVDSKNGFYIFRLIRKIPAGTFSLDKVEVKIRNYLINRKTEKLFEDWIKELREKAYIIIK